MTQQEGISKGKVVFSPEQKNRKVLERYIKAIERLKNEFSYEPKALNALEMIDTKLKALQWSELSEMELEAKLHTFARIPIGETFIDLRNYAKEGIQTVNTVEEFRNVAIKRVNNTLKVLRGLLPSNPDDADLRELLVLLQGFMPDADYNEMKEQLNEIFNGELLQHYNDEKNKMLLEWLKPFEEYFDKPIETLSKEELATALKKVESLKKTSLEEAGIVLNEEHDYFLPYNREMHPLVNGKNFEFWGSEEVRNEFIELVTKILKHFRFKLEDQFLIFTSSDQSMSYLLGFSDDAFSELQSNDTTLGIYPHVKIFHKTDDDFFKEMSRDFFSDPKEYYQILKTTMVPFLASMALMVDMELSKDFRSAFDMWL